jgi:hypothetical protein
LRCGRCALLVIAVVGQVGLGYVAHVCLRA